MKKKIITASVLGLMAFSAGPVFATESIAFSLNVYPTCTGCHTNANLNTADKGNLKAAAKTAYNKDKRTLSGLKDFLAISTTPAITCTLPEVLNTAKTACVTPPPPTCVAPKILNAAQTACVAPPPPTCVSPEILNTAKTACVTPPPTCSATEILNATKDACVAKPVVPTCSATEVLNAAKTACIAKPTTPVKNTKPKLNPVKAQWDVQVGETLMIPLSVIDDEEDEFTIATSKLVGSTLSDVYQNDAGFPTIDFEWTPTLANVNKIQGIAFQAKETATAKKYTSNKVAVKVRVWAAGDRDAASITKLNVMTSKFSAGTLKLAGNVKFNNLLTATERQAFIDQALPLTVNDASGSNLNSDSVTWSKNGNWIVSIPMISAPCDITLEFAGQNASRKVIGCSQIAQTNSDNILAANDDHDDDDDHDKKDDSHKKHDD